MPFRLSPGVLTLFVGAACAQTLSFEVASVKSAGPLVPQRILTGQQRLGKQVDRARVEYSSASLGSLIDEAYDVKSYQVSGPDFLEGMSAPRFDIQAKMPEGAGEAEIPQMLQALLTERFGLQFHRESRERTVYSLVVAKGGPKIKPAEAPASGESPDPGQGMQLSGNMQNGKGLTVSNSPLGGGTTRVNMSPDGRGLSLEMSSLSMARLAELLSRMVDRPVVDSTGLKGDYQVALDVPVAAVMAMAGFAGGAGAMRGLADAGDAGSKVFESIERLGLKLEQHKAPVDTLVIDHLEKTPTEN